MTGTFDWNFVADTCKWTGDFASEGDDAGLWASEDDPGLAPGTCHGAYEVFLSDSGAMRNIVEATSLSDDCRVPIDG